MKTVQKKRKRSRSGLTQVTFSIKMSIGLKNRIDELAQKALVARNRWIVEKLCRIAKYTDKTPSSQPVASGKV